jgi:NitT/TauT family transport system substrate-binding protein
MRALPLALVAALTAFPVAAKPWRHGIIAPAADAGFAMMAEKGGFADKEGLELETVAFPREALALPALLSGDIDSFEGAPLAAIRAAANQEDVRIIGCPWLDVTDAVFTRGTILAPQDLQGQIIAAAAPLELPALVADAYLAVNAIPAALVRFAEYGSDRNRFAALQSGVAAAAVVSLDYEPLAERASFRLAARGGELLPKFARLCIVATARNLRARREDAIRFLAAEMTALAHARKDRDAEIALARASAGLAQDDPRPAAIFAEAVKSDEVAPSLPIPLDRITAMEEVLVRSGAITGGFDPHDIIEDDIREEAIDRVAHD